jgi:CheY-like chemotaxis protein
MRCALLVDHDPESRETLTALLKARGYVVAPTGSAQTALHTAQTVRIDVVLTDTVFNVDDRRSFIGELGRLAPQAPVILLADSAAAIPIYHDHCSAVLAKPVTARALRRVLEFGVDGYGMLPIHPGWEHERRRKADRRHRSR